MQDPKSPGEQPTLSQEASERLYEIQVSSLSRGREGRESAWKDDKASVNGFGQLHTRC